MSYLKLRRKEPPDFVELELVVTARPRRRRYASAMKRQKTTALIEGSVTMYLTTMVTEQYYQFHPLTLFPFIQWIQLAGEPMQLLSDIRVLV